MTKIKCRNVCMTAIGGLKDILVQVGGCGPLDLYSVRNVLSTEEGSRERFPSVHSDHVQDDCIQSNTIFKLASRRFLI